MPPFGDRANDGAQIHAGPTIASCHAPKCMMSSRPAIQTGGDTYLVQSGAIVSSLCAFLPVLHRATMLWYCCFREAIIDSVPAVSAPGAAFSACSTWQCSTIRFFMYLTIVVQHSLSLSKAGHGCQSSAEAVSLCCRKPRRKKLAILLMTELVTQWVNVTFFLVPNINLLARPCDIWSILVREQILPFINAWPPCEMA